LRKPRNYFYLREKKNPTAMMRKETVKASENKEYTLRVD